MKITRLSVFLLVASIFLSACGASEAEVQTAIAMTANANSPTPSPIPATSTPEITDTPVPTSTPTPTDTPQPPPNEERIIGTWSGAMTNANGDKLPATWTIIEGGVMVIEVLVFDVSYGAEWRVEGDRIHITTELDPDNPTYRDIEFVNDDLMILTKDESEIRETWTRENAQAE